jgi:hypothetical protein
MADNKGLFDEAYTEIAFKQELVSVTASWWAVGRSQEEIEKETRRQLKENQGIDYPEKKK